MVIKEQQFIIIQEVCFELSRIVFWNFLIWHHSMDPFHIYKNVMHFIRDNVKTIYRMHFSFFRKDRPSAFVLNVVIVSSVMFFFHFQFNSMP